MSKRSNKQRASNARYAVDRLVSDYLEFFHTKEHEIVPGAPLLPEDPTLLFTSAGMVPFKAYYSSPDSAPYPRAASVQKCLRAGGKQSDLENVGRTLRHHTFFEMLGNFSFGDYFKKEAIEWAWELSVDVWEMDEKRIWVSVFEEDDEAFELWADHIGFPRDRIVRMGKSDNFWGPVGETGVCGPSSEMYFDTDDERAGDGARPGDPGTEDRIIEYWNLVFPQFFYTHSGAYEDLPRPGIDTGLGLERMAVILQKVPDNYHTDEFLPIRDAIAGALPDEATRDRAGVAINVASDHVRALTFALAEGIMPSNDGRGYVLRRLLRRALTKMQPFGVREPFLAGAVDVVVEKMGGRYPELAGRSQLVKEVVTVEEERFLSTLEQGMDKLESVLDRALAAENRRVDGGDAFILYDTYGFPLELTEELARDRGLTVDRDGFEVSMAEQKERARRSGLQAVSQGDTAGFEEIDALEATEFLGYDRFGCDGRLAAYRVARDRTSDGRAFHFVTDRTVFYAESGGQVGDTGAAEIGGRRFEVTDAYYDGARIAHVAVWPGGDDSSPDTIARFLEDNRDVTLEVDREKRLSTMRNHTATHLLHEALRRVLGDHVTQAGSLVAPDRLRFDFHHFQAMTDAELEEVERIVNEAVMSDMEVSKRYMSYREALAEGATALFGEKYGESVRVVSVDDFSIELCGGTHLDRTGQIGSFIIRQESAIGAGIRRVEALTGRGAVDYRQAVMKERRGLADLLRVAPEEMDKRVRSLLEEADALQRQLKKDASRRARDETAEAMETAVEVGGVKFIAITVDAPDVGSLRRYGDELRNKLDRGVGLVCQNAPRKPVVLVVVSDSLVRDKTITASDITKRISEKLQYRGGGKPHMAQVGIPDKNDFGQIVEFVRAELESSS